MQQYLIMGQFFEVPDDCLGDYYLDILVNDIFPSLPEAAAALDNAMEEMLQEYNEESERVFLRRGDSIVDSCGNVVVTMFVQSMSHEPTEATINDTLRNACGKERCATVIECVKVDGEQKYLVRAKASQLLTASLSNALSKAYNMETGKHA